MEALWVLPLIIVVAAMLPFVTALIEKRRVWPYSPEFPFEPFELSAQHQLFLKQARLDAHQYGFTYLQRCYDNKGKSYRLVYDFMISEDGFTLAVLGAGKILTIPLQGAWLFSKTADGHAVVTVTNQSADEYDLSGLTQSNLIITDDFQKAFRSHIEKTNAYEWPFERFAPGKELEDLLQLKCRRLNYMQQKKWIKLFGPDDDQWKYTALGALKWSIAGVVIGTLRYPASVWKGLFGK